MIEDDPLYFDRLATPIGTLIVAASDAGLCQVKFSDGSTDELPGRWICSPQKVRDAVLQITEYFSRKRTSFDLQLAPRGTAFQLNVWQELTTIPYGETITYGELAERVNNRRGSRAVGNANGRNPLVIIQPCHRVVAAGNQLGGFSAGIFRKQYLLRLERGVTGLFHPCQAG